MKNAKIITSKKRKKSAHNMNTALEIRSTTKPISIRTTRMPAPASILASKLKKSFM